MGILDNLKESLGLDNDDDAVADAQKKADEAAEAAKEARKKANDEKAEKADEARKAADEAEAEAKAKRAEADEAAREAGERKAKEGAAKPTAPKKDAARTYTVKSGDTLSAIGAKFGVSWQEIAKVNNIDNPDLIYPGQTFKIPN